MCKASSAGGGGGGGTKGLVVSPGNGQTPTMNMCESEDTEKNQTCVSVFYRRDGCFEPSAAKTGMCDEYTDSRTSRRIFFCLRVMSTYKSQV